jgi:hypothetical protein
MKMALGPTRASWWWVIGALWFFLLIRNDLLETYQRYFDGSVWIAATVKVHPSTPPLIRYSVVVSRPVEATWSAWIEDAGGNRISRPYGGEGVYLPGRAPHLWTWGAFFGEPFPPVPGSPYRVCVRYVAKSSVGVRRAFGPYCSEVTK